MNKYLSITIKILIIFFLILAVGWAGTCAYANFFHKDTPQLNTPKMPEIDKAGYTIYMKATRQTILTDDWQEGRPGIYLIKGYWEVIEDEYKYRDSNLTLNEEYFGEIIIRKRAE